MVRLALGVEGAVCRSIWRSREGARRAEPLNARSSSKAHCGSDRTAAPNGGIQAPRRCVNSSGVHCRGRECLGLMRYSVGAWAHALDCGRVFERLPIQPLYDLELKR